MALHHITQLYRKIGEGLGLIAPEPTPLRTPSQIKRAEAAIASLESVQQEWRKQGVALDDIRRAIKLGRS